MRLIHHKNNDMTFYVILQFDKEKGWDCLPFGPWLYLPMKYKMQELKKNNKGVKYRLQKTNY
jgi:hypothetical protein